jgi:murein DD-endopeptidase MepM/ murein hydrolase activator NlpD
MTTFATPATDALALDPDAPGSRLLIDRVGALSARLIRLESEAVNLARQVGVSAAGEGDASTAAAATADTAADVSGPSGGPLLAPLDAADDFAPTLSQLSRDLDRIDATFALVAQAAALRNLASMAFPSRAPIDGGALSSGFGNRRDPFTHRLARHTGLDIRAPRGAPILASAGGRVTFAGYRGAYGNTVEIDHGNGLKTRYGHASRLYVHRGDIVLPRQRIAAVGSSGRSTGPHLHFEVLRNGAPVEPRLYLARSPRAGGPR